MLSRAEVSKLLYSNSVVGATTIAPAVGAPSSGAPSETQSEISSADSDFSDIRAIAIRLGVENVDDLHTERFKVDRQKLEQMIKEESPVEGMNGAEYFFESVMKSTGTYIGWPCRLKIGGKSKKDPLVRVIGRSEEVKRAKDRVLFNLDSRGTRVIMKMDVSYTDHSYIIGRGGNNIKRIMLDTGTHIHFPDSNRSNPSEKSNQVSLCGSMEGVERARALVRLSTPLLISFELPILAAGHQHPNNDTPYVKSVEWQYNVQVIFSSRPKLHSCLVLVKGSEKEAAKVQAATQLLINFCWENNSSQMQVQMHMEISKQHQEIVKGKNSSNLLEIMEHTKTKIIFPDLSDFNVAPLKKSHVLITGTIDGVYKARQQLLGNLPIALIFDFPDNQNNAFEVIGLSTKYGVYISLRQKPRQSTLAIVVKGVEKFIDKIYEARHEILRLSSPLIKPSIPETYFLPRDKDLNLGYRMMLTSLLAGYPDSPKNPALLTAHLQMSPFGINGQQHNNNNNLLVNNRNNNNNCKSYPPGFGPCALPPNVCPPTQKYVAMLNSSFGQQQQLPNDNNNNYLNTPPLLAPQPHQRAQQTAVQQHQQQQQQVSPRNSCHNTSGYRSFSSSTTSLEQVYPPYGGGSASMVGCAADGGGGVAGSRLLVPNGGAIDVPPRDQYSPDSTYSNDAGFGRSGRRASDGVLLGLGSSGPLVGGAESYRNLHHDLKQSLDLDFDMKRVVGFKAMERPPVSGELRTPTPNWAGMALSRTSPGILECVDDGLWSRNVPGTSYGNGGNAAGGAPISPYAFGVTVGLMDATPTNRRLKLSAHGDIHTLLTSLGLEHYIKTFVTNEIDLEMFTTLTEGNLLELGITAFGARRKMMVAINTLKAGDHVGKTPTNNSSLRFSGSAAPGAERRLSSQW